MGVIIRYFVNLNACYNFLRGYEKNIKLSHMCIPYLGHVILKEKVTGLYSFCQIYKKNQLNLEKNI